VRYRSKIEIVAAVLDVARKRAKKTHIMYRGNLSFRLLNAYLNVVMRAGLIRFIREDECYLLTEKGRMFLEKFNRYHKRVKGLEKRLTQTKGKMASLEELCFAADLPNNNEARNANYSDEKNGKSAKSNSLVKPSEF